jgi:glucose/arabinose dehydrogenase
VRVPKLLLPAVALSLIAAAPASAHRGVSVKRIAKQLDNPRHVAVAADGDVYVAEAGSGGDAGTGEVLEVTLDR